MMTCKTFAAWARAIRDNPTEDGLMAMTDDLGYIEILLKLIPDEALEEFGNSNLPLFSK